jgi:hypothetical protein
MFKFSLGFKINGLPIWQAIFVSGCANVICERGQEYWSDHFL